MAGDQLSQQPDSYDVGEEVSSSLEEAKVDDAALVAGGDLGAD